MNPRFFRRLKFLRRRTKLDRELAEEIEFHRTMKERENGEQGLAPDAARQSAQRQMGNLTQAKESSRDAWSFPFLEQLLQDLSVALRSLRRDRGFAIVAILSLALGIGANTAIFTALNAVLLRPLPYVQPQQLFAITQPMAHRGAYAGIPIVDPDFEAWRNENKVFDQLTCWSGGEIDFKDSGPPERLTVAEVPTNFLKTLGISPTLGRNFSPQEDRPNGSRAVILTNGFWHQHFSRQHSVLGQQVKMNGAAFTIVGVLPASFRFPGDITPELLAPAQLPSKPNWGNMMMHGVTVIGRLRPGITPERAVGDLKLITKRHEPDMPAWLHHFRQNLPSVRITPLQTQLIGDTRWTLWLLFAAVLLLLGIACANVANLQLSRAAKRQGELALRAALGAGRARLARFLLTESLLLSLAGGACGVLLAWGLVHVLGATPLLHLKNKDPLQIASLQINGTVLLFTFLTAAVAGLICGAFPALFASKPILHEAIKCGTAPLVGLGSRFRGSIVLGEIALTLVLLVGALLLFRSLQNVLAVTPGFQPENVLTFRTDFRDFARKTTAQKSLLLKSELDSIQSIPGVRSVGASTSLPLTGYTLGTAIRIEGQPAQPPGQAPAAPTMMVSPGYFRTLHVPLLAGRSFTPDDTDRSVPVAVVNASFAQHLFAKADPLGKRLHYGPQSTPWVTVVGIVANVHHEGLEKEASPELFLPYAQNFLAPLAGVAIRTTLPSAALLPTIRKEIAKIDPAQPIFDIATMDHRLSESTGSRRTQTALISSFALIALCLAAIGVYGVLSYAVTQTTREIGIRMALGAQKGTVLRSVVRRGALLASGGIIIGLAVSLATVRYLASFLYHVKPLDWISFTAGALLLFALAILASYLPARRAANVDPMTALRYE